MALGEKPFFYIMIGNFGTWGGWCWTRVACRNSYSVEIVHESFGLCIGMGELLPLKMMSTLHSLIVHFFFFLEQHKEENFCILLIGNLIGVLLFGYDIPFCG